MALEIDGACYNRWQVSSEIELHQQEGPNYRLPLYSSSVSAGFPSSADDYIETWLNLNEHLIEHPAATFLVRVSGNSMRGRGILHNDILIVDRSLKPVHGRIVVAAVDGHLTVKELYQREKTMLLAANKHYPPLELRDGQELQIWGVAKVLLREAV